MRAFHIAVLLGIMASTVPILKAQAGADVLVPSDNTNNSESSPDLGLMPGDSAPSRAQPQTPAAPPATAAMPGMPALPQTPSVAGYPGAVPSAQSPLANLPPEQIDTMKARIAQMQAQIQAIPPEQMEAMQAKALAMQAQLQAVMPAAPDFAKTGLPQMPTTVVRGPDTSQAIKNQENLPYSIDVSFNGNGLSTLHLQLISSQLGIPNPAKACHISASGYIQTTKDSKAGMSVFDLGLENHGTAKYDGKITQVMTMIRALCDMPSQLPANKGVILQVGDKYSASLGTTSCSAAASGTPRQIIVTLPDNGAPKCQIN